MYGGHRAVVGDGGSTPEAGVVTVIQLAVDTLKIWRGGNGLTDSVSPDDRSSYAARMDARKGNPRAVVYIKLRA